MKTVEPARIPSIEVQELVKALAVHGAYIAGSFAAWLASRDAAAPNDIDIWLPSQDSFTYKHVCDLLVDMSYAWNSATISDWAESYRIDHTATNQGFFPASSFQVINPLNSDPGRLTWGEPEVLIAEFDFSVVQAAVLPDLSILVGDSTIEDIRVGELIVTRTTTPAYSLGRAIKKAGHYTLPHPQLIRLLDAYAKQSENDRQDNHSYFCQ